MKVSDASDPTCRVRLTLTLTLADVGRTMREGQISVSFKIFNYTGFRMSSKEKIMSEHNE